MLALPTRARRGWLRLLRELARREVLELLIEGGAGIVASAVKARVVNQLTIFYNPRLIGGDGVPLVAGLGIADPHRAPRWKTVEVRPCGSDLLWRGRPAPPARG